MNVENKKIEVKPKWQAVCRYELRRIRPIFFHSVRTCSTASQNRPQVNAHEERLSSSAAEDASAISKTLDANQANINKWLSGNQRDLKIESTLSKNIGVTTSKGSASIVDTANLRLILRRDPSMSNGYRIQTGFPTQWTPIIPISIT